MTPGAADDSVACQESFKFHLGTQQHDMKHFMNDWTSSTKYEGTFVGHTYHFRLAHDPTVLVQTVTLAPTQVMDCPEEKVAVAIGVGGEAEPLAVGRQEGFGDGTDDEEDNGGVLYGAFAAAAAGSN